MHREPTSSQKSKDKFENPDEHVQGVILNILVEFAEMSVSTPTDSFKKVVNCPAEAKSQSCLNQMLHLKKFKVSI